MMPKPSITYLFSVIHTGNNWSEFMVSRFSDAIQSIDIDYVNKEIQLEIINTVDLVIQQCICDIVDNGMSILTLNVKDGLDGVDQQVICSGIEVKFHSLRYRYAEQCVAYHYLVLSYSEMGFEGER